MTSRYRLRAAFTLFLTVLAGSTIFFRWAEGWDWVDAYYFSVVTMATVGYGDIAPSTAVGKIGATVLIMVGIGILAVFLQSLAERMVEARARRMDGKRKD